VVGLSFDTREVKHALNKRDLRKQRALGQIHEIIEGAKFDGQELHDSQEFQPSLDPFGSRHTRRSSHRQKLTPSKTIKLLHVTTRVAPHRSAREAADQLLLEFANQSSSYENPRSLPP
jgi:hypothetical protein